MEDTLFVSIAAFTALRMCHFAVSARLYFRTIAILRRMLHRWDASSMDNLSYFRLWSTVLLLAEYENQSGDQVAQYYHLSGAAILSVGAQQRFPQLREGSHDTPSLETTPAESWTRTPPLSTEDFRTTATIDCQRSGTRDVPAFPQAITRVETDLPRYLLSLHRRLEHSKAIRITFDTHWPLFQIPADRDDIGLLHIKCSELDGLIMPMITQYYEAQSMLANQFASEYRSLLASFQRRVQAARRSIHEYQQLASEVYKADNKVYFTCAKLNFPFIPVIKFIDPQMAQPNSVPHMFLMFLAPFISVEEHRQSIFYISGVFAEFLDDPGLLLDASFPDIHVAAFWRLGPERDYCTKEVERRGGDFAILLRRIWRIIDDVQVSQNGEDLSPASILGISLSEYRAALRQGMRLKNTRH